MAYTYSQLQTVVAQNISISSSNTDFLSVFDDWISHSELRIYRDLDLLSTVFRDTGGTLVANQRLVTLPTTYGTFVVVQGVNLLIGGARVGPLTPVSRDLLDAFYPAELAATGTSVPTLFARDTDAALLVAPTAGASANASLEIVGTVRPAQLSSANPTTFISTWLPDLFMAAMMVSASGWMKNYGTQADDPKLAMSWETAYQQRIGPARTDEMRKRFARGDWSAKFATQMTTQG